MSKLIALYGNIVVDTVFETDIMEWSESASVPCNRMYRHFGGMYNVLNALDKLNHDEVICNFDAGSHAAIICNLSNGTRTSFVHWTDDKYVPSAIKADWHHIGYLDRLPYLTKQHLMQMQGTISADLCCSQHTEDEKARVRDLASCVDFLLMSDMEAKSLFGDKPKCIAKQAIIIHSPSGFEVFDKKGIIYRCQNRPLKPKRNVLGAGDYFAAVFMHSMLSGHNFNDSVFEAYAQTKQSLL